MIDPRVSDVMARSRDVRLTWQRAQMGLDLKQLNDKYRAEKKAEKP